MFVDLKCFQASFPFQLKFMIIFVTEVLQERNLKVGLNCHYGVGREFEGERGRT